MALCSLQSLPARLGLGFCLTFRFIDRKIPFQPPACAQLVTAVRSQLSGLPYTNPKPCLLQHDGGGLPEMLGMGDSSYGGQSLQQLPEQYGGGYASGAGAPYQQHGGFGGQQWGAPAVSSQREPPPPQFGAPVVGLCSQAPALKSPASWRVLDAGRRPRQSYVCNSRIRVQHKGVQFCSLSIVHVAMSRY